MFKGSKQGGGGNSLVLLTGLFKFKSGKPGAVGSIKTEAFDTVYKLMQEADEKGVELVLIVTPPKQGPPNMEGELFIGVGRSKEERVQQPELGRQARQRYATRPDPAQPGVGGSPRQFK